MTIIHFVYCVYRANILPRSLNRSNKVLHFVTTQVSILQMLFTTTFTELFGHYLIFITYVLARKVTMSKVVLV